MKYMYMKHVAMNGVLKAIERAGGSVDYISMHSIGDGASWVEGIRNPSAGGGKIAQFDIKLATYYGEAGRAERDRLVSAVLNELPESFSDRSGSSVSVYGIMHGISYEVSIGEALCERVQTGVRTLMKPAPDAPMIEVSEPIYEYRCSDDIMGRMPSKEA